MGVEIEKEPKIESRFGFQRNDKALSPKMIKCCAIVTAISLSSIFLMKSPEQTITSRSVIEDPKNLESISEKIDVDSYSAFSESEQIKNQNKNHTTSAIVRFPGLEKIDRRHSGQIPPGSIVKAVLITGASNGLVRVETKETLRIQGETLIPKGAILLGTGQSTEECLAVRFTQLVFKDGSFEDIQAQAANADDKTVCLRGSRVGRYAMKYGAAIGLHFVGGMTDGLQERGAIGEQAVAKANIKNALLNGTSRATLEMANETLTELKSRTPIIHIETGREILVIFEGGK